MALPFAIPNATDMEDIWTISRFAHSASGGFLFLSILAIIWVIAFIGSLSEGRKVYRGWIFANFICAILSIILALLGLVQLTYIYFFVILLGFGLIWAKLVDSPG